VHRLRALAPDWPTRAGLACLALQAALVAYSLPRPANDFAWAPYTTQAWYEVTVDLPGRRLTGSAAARRYHLWSPPWEVHSHESLIGVIRQYETTLGAGDGARVHLRYRVNRGPEREWRWPHP